MDVQQEQERWKHIVAEEAVRFVKDGMLLGLGTGSTATCFLHALARRMATGLTIAGAVPTSQTTASLAARRGIPLTDLDAHPQLDLAFDGADQVDEQLNLIKGKGGALLREKGVAAASQQFLVMVDFTKYTAQLGQQVPLPVEVLPFASTPVRKALERLGATPLLRKQDGKVYLTEQGNVICDCYFSNSLGNLLMLEEQILRIPGVVVTGLFLAMTNLVIIGGPESVRILNASSWLQGRGGGMSPCVEEGEDHR